MKIVEKNMDKICACMGQISDNFFLVINIFIDNYFDRNFFLFENKWIIVIELYFLKL